MGMWALLGIFTAVALICCCIGFYRFVYFLSVGYGFAVFGLGVAYLITAIIKGSWDIICILQCVLFMAYGFRLSFFLLIREIKNASYRKVLKEATKEDSSKMPIFVASTIWLFVGILYVMQTAPVFFRIFNAGENPPETLILPIIGVVISTIGLVLETVADIQKSNQKKINPNMVATKGLYRMVRCPNYLGEIMFWTGVLVAAVTSLKGVAQWIISIIGWICIVYIMINGAQRLDKRQEARYQNNEEYRAYADHTPIILPLIPISHIGMYKVADIEAAKKAKEEKKANKGK